MAAAARRQVLRREITSRLGKDVIEALRDLRVVRYPHASLLDRIWALRDNLTAADAAYVALAEALAAPLVTTDAALACAPGVTAEVVAYPG